MRSKIILRFAALAVLIMLASIPASAAVRFHVFVGPRAYPVYPNYYPYANYYVAPAYPYYSYPYYYSYPHYNSYYSFGWHHRRHEWREHREHEYREHVRR